MLMWSPEAQHVKPVSDPQHDHPFLLSTSPPARNQERLAACLVGALICVLLIVAPFARQPLAKTEILVPAYGAAIMVNELITAALLLALFSVHRSRAVLVLAAGYLFSGLLVVPWALTFPGVFATLDLDAGLQSTAAIAALRRLGFPVFVLAYALLRTHNPSIPDAIASVRAYVAGSVVGVVAFTCGATWLIATQQDLLPAMMTDTANVGEAWGYVPSAAIALYLSGLAALRWRGCSTLDFWLTTVLVALLIEIVLLSYVSAGIRLSIGWWVGRLCGLTSASIVLLVLLSESTRLHARLTRAVAAERRSRANRLTAMEALSASIAHEVNQPLASMVTNADAGLRWLGGRSPDPAEVKAALQRIVSEGHRASKVVDGIRTMFRKDARERVPLDLNQQIAEVLQHNRSELLLARVCVETGLDPRLPAVIGNPVQLQQVVSNLVSNAIDAMASPSGRPQVLRVTSRPHEFGEVLVSVEDTGPGLDPREGERIFEPFFSTKPNGMGMGLMFCRSIVEAHGGRLWARNRPEGGAVFHFSLPSDAAANLAPGVIP